MPDYLRILGPFHAMTGYSHMTRAVLRMALLAGFTVQAVESDERITYTMYGDGRVTLLHDPPKVRTPLPDCQWTEIESSLTTEIPQDAPTLMIQLPQYLNPRGRFTQGTRIGWTMGESDRICSTWAAGCRGVDTLFVPSEWCYNAFRGSLPDMNINVMPLPVDDRIFNLEGLHFELPEHPPFLFLSVFSTTVRKQWRLVMQAFAEEFKGDDGVGLLVRPTETREVNEMAAWCRDAGAWIQVIDRAVSDHDMAALYRACDCFVLPSPEGFGLPFVEAGLCGLPSIALDRGGAADVVTPESGYLCPTELKPLIGHAPHIYPSTHRFPQTDFSSLRCILRQAYEEHPAKVDKAHLRAQLFTPESLAPWFRDRLEMAQAQNCRRRHALFVAPKRSVAHIRRPQWALALGAWGDTFCSVGMALEKRHPKRPLNLLYFGRDPTTADFLRAQPFIEEVRSIQPPDKAAFMDLWNRAAMSRFTHADRWRTEVAELCDCDPDDLLFTQINQGEDQPIARWHDAALPSSYRTWAEDQRRLWGDYILLHPLSTQSAGRGEHWPSWEEAITWLLAETPFTYVLTGQNPLKLRSSERLIDLIGHTDNMMQVLALCEQAKGVISTCNAVSLWTVMQRIPGLIVCNSVFNEPNDYYHRWVNTEPNTLVYQYEPLHWFQKIAREWLAARCAP